jgi:hypothetical protein
MGLVRWWRRRRYQHGERRFRRLIEDGWLPCPRCDGSGKEQTYGSGYLTPPTWQQCTGCRGEGMRPPA